MLQNSIKKIIFSALAVIFITGFSVSVAGAATIKSPPANTGLVGYWSFNEGSGTFASDLSGNGNNATLVSGTEVVSGKISKAVKFNGASTYGSVEDSSSLKPTQAVTVSTWVRFDSLYGSVKCGTSASYETGWIVFKRNSRVSNFAGYSLVKANSGFSFQLSSSGGTTDSASYSTTVETGRWYHIVGVFSKPNMSLYVDGVLVGTGTHNFDLDHSTLPLYFGRTGECGSNKFDTLTPQTSDEVRIYNRALSAAEVSQLYRSGSTIRKTVSNTGLVGYWSFNEGTSTLAGDASGNGNTGTLTNMAFPPTSTSGWGTGKLGKGLNFDGTNDYVDTGTGHNVYQQTTPFSGAAWIKTTTTNERQIISKWAAVSSAGWQFFMDDLSPGKVGFLLANSNGSLVRRARGSTNVNDGQWHHVAFTYDGSSSAAGIQIYVDGIAETMSIVANNNPGALADTPLRIGQRSGTLSSYFLGSIDDVRLYNRALSATEVAQLYKTNETRFAVSKNDVLTDGLVGLWSFDARDMNYMTAYDRSGSGNNGVLTNMATSSFVPGKIGQALNFGNSNDAVAINTTPITSTTGDWTISAWMKPANLNQNGFVFYNAKGGIGFGIAGTGGTDSAGNRLRGVFDGVTWLNTSYFFTESNIWYHVVMRRSSGTTEFFVDGVSVATYSSTPNSTIYGTTHIGASGSSAGRNFSGLVDDVRVYNKAITNDEVKVLYSAGR